MGYLRKSKVGKTDLYPDNSDLIIIVGLIIAGILIHLPHLDEPLISDPTDYASLAKSIADGDGYKIDGEDYNRKPPLYPLSAAPLVALTENPTKGLRITAMLWSILAVLLTYILARKLRITQWRSGVIAALLLLNPWFIYFTGTLPYAEGMGMCLLLLSIMSFLWWQKLLPKHDWTPPQAGVTGILFGLAIVTKSSLAFLILPFIAAYLLRDVIKKRSLWKVITWDHFLLVLFTILPQASWTLRNLAVTSGVTDYISLVDRSTHTPYMLVLYIVFMVPLAMLVLTPNLLLNLGRTIRTLKPTPTDTFIRIFLAGSFVYILLLSATTFYGTFFSIITSKIRFIIMILPILLILCFYTGGGSAGGSSRSLLFDKLNGLVNHRIYLGIALIVSIVLLGLLNCGWVQEFIGGGTGGPDTYVHRTYYRTEAIDLINDVALSDSVVLVMFVEPGEDKMIGLEDHISDMFRKDLTVITDIEQLTSTGLDKGLYILTEEETSREQLALETGQGNIINVFQFDCKSVGSPVAIYRTFI